MIKDEFFHLLAAGSGLCHKNNTMTKIAILPEPTIKALTVYVHTLGGG